VACFTKPHGRRRTSFESAAFVRSKAGIKYPDIQYHFCHCRAAMTGSAAAEGTGFKAMSADAIHFARVRLTPGVRRPSRRAQDFFSTNMSHGKDLGGVPQLHFASTPRDLCAGRVQTLRQTRYPARGLTCKAMTNLMPLSANNCRTSRHHPAATCRNGPVVNRRGRRSSRGRGVWR